MRNPRTLTDPALVEALIFDVPEAMTSASMVATTKTCCDQLEINVTTIDAWTNPEAVRKHGVLVGPTVILLAEGKEIGRLSGPSCKAVRRLFKRVVQAPQPELLAA